MSATILVVEDHPKNRKLVCDLLGFEGHQVLQAEDAEQAQSLLADTLPDLILMDLDLPGMDGLSLTRLLKADARTRAIPIVALTAFAMPGDERLALGAGCDGYLTKPLDTRAFAGQVAAFLSSPRSRP